MKLPKVPSSTELLDRAFKRSLKVKSSNTNRHKKAKEEEIGRVNALSDTVSGALMKVRRDFPPMEAIHPFSRAIVDVEFGIDNVKNELASLQWAAGKVASLANATRKRIGASESPAEMTKIRREYSGRLSSIIDDVDKSLTVLERTRLLLKEIPELSPNEKTLVVAGVPNVGKSMLVRRLSTANPDVAVYPFTTKGVTIGHMEWDYVRIQVMDIPGLLDRPAQERNEIELKGIAALKEAADMVIFVFDPSETCGYSMSSQENLLAEISKIGDFPILKVSNKSDIVQSIPDTISISAMEEVGIDELKQEIFSMATDLSKDSKRF